MSPTQKASLVQNQRMRLSQQQLRYVRMLELTAPELDEAVVRELEDNPALSAGDTVAASVAVSPQGEVTRQTRDEEPSTDFSFRPSADESLLRRANPDNDVDFTSIVQADSGSLYDELELQLSERELSPEVREVAIYIIGNLDSNGYLRRSIGQLIDDLAFGPGVYVTPRQAEEALGVVRSLDPPGIAAFDLRECLELQLERMPESTVRDNALRIIREQFDAFANKHTERLSSPLRIDQRAVDEAVELILTLNPKPGASMGGNGDRAAAIVPDVFVSNEDGNLTITLNNRLPELRIDTTFEQAVRQMNANAESKRRSTKKGNEFVTTRYNDAREFIRILRQRQQTMLDVMTAIVKIQRDYFMTEDIYRLHPMMIKDIAAMTGHDLSVISRATTNKSVATPWGIFPLRFFFSDSIGDDNEDKENILTNRKIEAEIVALVEAEDKKHPLSDEKLRSEMESRGYEVSRRTIAKYRDRVGIPVARLRRKL